MGIPVSQSIGPYNFMIEVDTIPFADPQDGDLWFEYTAAGLYIHTYADRSWGKGEHTDPDSLIVSAVRHAATVNQIPLQTSMYARVLDVAEQGPK